MHTSVNPRICRILSNLLLAVALLTSSCTSDTAPPTPKLGPEERIWSNDPPPGVVDTPVDRPIELGTKFTTASDGSVTALRVYQGPNDPNPDTVTLWNFAGEQLVSAAVPPGPAGWREIRLNKPVEIEADSTYIVSQRATRGHYPSSPTEFASGRKIHGNWLTATGGVYTYQSGPPNQSSLGASYLVDVVFQPSGPSLRPVDGGPEYFSTFKNSFPVSPSFFPLGIWYTSTHSPEEISGDRDLGLNTYVMLSEDSDVGLIRKNDMFALPAKPHPDAAGLFLMDEADMWAGAGDAPWTGKVHPDRPVCIPEDAKCGYTVMMSLRNTVPSGLLSYANYGKGVTFWQTPSEAARFINDFQGLVSVDNYWFTDNEICQGSQGGLFRNNSYAQLPSAVCHLAANYGATTHYIRSLVHPRAALPVWTIVELGHPAEDSDGGTITGPQLRAAVWSSIINGARGIIYFAHSFGGSCLSYNVLRDRCGDPIRGDLAAVNHQISRLSPVLNSPFLDGYARSDGPVDVTAKFYDGDAYVFAGATRPESSEARITLTCGKATSAEVIDENRSVPIVNGSFSDGFADGNAVHLYKIGKTDGCPPLSE
jgi:hypothetical protein